MKLETLDELAISAIDALEDPFPGARTVEQELSDANATALELARQLDEQRRAYLDAAEERERLRRERDSMEEAAAELGLRCESLERRIEWQVDVIDWLLDRRAAERNR